MFERKERWGGCLIATTQLPLQIAKRWLFFERKRSCYECLLSTCGSMSHYNSILWQLISDKSSDLMQPYVELSTENKAASALIILLRPLHVYDLTSAVPLSPRFTLMLCGNHMWFRQKSHAILCISIWAHLFCMSRSTRARKRCMHLIFAALQLDRMRVHTHAIYFSQSHCVLWTFFGVSLI